MRVLPVVVFPMLTFAPTDFPKLVDVLSSLPKSDLRLPLQVYRYHRYHRDHSEHAYDLSTDSDYWKTVDAFQGNNVFVMGIGSIDQMSNALWHGNGFFAPWNAVLDHQIDPFFHNGF